MESLTWLHAGFAILAAFRLTALFTQDTLWNWPRRWMPAVPWHCGLCMSVWAGALATASFVWLPWINWPLALSWLWLAAQASKPRTAMDKPSVPQPDAPSDLDIRIGALSQEYGVQIAQLALRGATLAAELASAQAKLASAQKRVAELEPKPAEPALKAVE